MSEFVKIFKDLLNEDVRNKEDLILRALRGNNLCRIKEYTSKVPGYGSVQDDRLSLILAFGIGRFNNEKCIRTVQANSNASWGAKQEPPRGSDYKILYLKDIEDIQILPSKVTTAPPLFNSLGDKWMKETIETANFSNVPTRTQTLQTIQKTDREKALEKLPRISPVRVDVGEYERTTQERFRELKSIANTFLNIYNRARRAGDTETAQRALDKFRETQRISNQYMAAYKKELNRKQT
jgi:hypothetical protein